MKRTTETGLVRAVLVWLQIAKPKGVWWRCNVGAVQVGKRFVRFGLPGQSDIQGVCDGAAWFIECKTAKGKLSPAQVAFRDAVGKAGAFYVVVRSITDLEQIFD